MPDRGVSRLCRILQVLDPRSAVKDADKMASDSVKKDLDALKKYQSATKDISAMLVRVERMFHTSKYGHFKNQ